jgi:two-component system chemotaxis response regulator CheY
MKKRILIVDDSIYMRMMIKRILENAGYDVVGEAANGETAIEMALELEPDLITLDNVLPDMFGLEILNVLSEEELASRVLMISAVGQESVIEKEMKVGARGYIVKPFTEDQLLENIERVFSKELLNS